jgi:hypothetical protein
MVAGSRAVVSAAAGTLVACVGVTLLLQVSLLPRDDAGTARQLLVRVRGDVCVAVGDFVFRDTHRVPRLPSPSLPQADSAACRIHPHPFPFLHQFQSFCTRQMGPTPQRVLGRGPAGADRRPSKRPSGGDSPISPNH